jgi:hypothetical protein
MKRLITAALAGCISLSVAGVFAGCSASASVEPDHARPASSRDDTYYKKTEVRDANGNIVEKKVETKSY